MCIKKGNFLNTKKNCDSYIFSEKREKIKKIIKNSEIQHTQYNIEKDYKKVYIPSKKILITVIISSFI